MKTLLLLPAVLLVLSTAACGTTLAADPAPLAACPGKVEYVDVEADAGKFNPPALLAPTWDNGRTDNHFANLYSEWTDLANQDIVLHCHMLRDPAADPKAPAKVVDVKVPAEANKCTRFQNEVSCFVAPAKPANPATSSPTAKP